MRRLPDCTRVEPEDLPAASAGLLATGWRLVTASCVPRPDGARTVLYHFERGERLRHLRVELPAEGSVPSISGVYPGAFLVENEMRELQGLAIEGLTIDYGGRLYRDFDATEGWIHEPGGTEAIGPLAVAGSLGLDACVPVSDDGREVRAPTSRVPPATDDPDPGRRS